MLPDTLEISKYERCRSQKSGSVRQLLDVIVCGPPDGLYFTGGCERLLEIATPCWEKKTKNQETQQEGVFCFNLCSFTEWCNLHQFTLGHSNGFLAGLDFAGPRFGISIN